MSRAEEAACERAIEVVNAAEWKGDIRQNMTTVIGAGRVLAKRVAELERLIVEAERSAKFLHGDVALSTLVFAADVDESKYSAEES